MATLKNCPTCGRLFMDLGVGVCHDCHIKEEEMEEQAASYVRDNPRCSVKMICEETGIPERIIRRMIRQGRFISEGLDVSYPCKSCGKPIVRGEYCPACQSAMQKEIVAQQKKNIETGFGMKKAGMYSNYGKETPPQDKKQN